MKTRPPCIGAVFVVPVPHGMTLQDAWDEITTLGRLANPPRSDNDVEWSLLRCPGGDDCRCRFIDLAPNHRRYHNDRLVAARVLGVPIPRRLLSIVAALSRRP